MKKTLKICLLVFFILLLVFFTWALIFSVQMLKESIEVYQYVSSNDSNAEILIFKNNIVLSCFSVVFSLISIFFTVFVSIKLSLWHFPKYIYEEFKTMMDKRKAEKQEKKKQKLQQQLNSLDKTE